MSYLFEPIHWFCGKSKGRFERKDKNSSMHKKLLKQNVANIITFTRFILAIIIFRLTFLLFHDPSYYKRYLLFYLLAWLSDFFDGRIARRLEIASKTGAIFDLLVDCFFVFLLNIQVMVMKLLPFAFLFLLCEKVLNYVITSKIMNGINPSQSHFWNDKIGRLVAASFYVIPWFVVSLKVMFPGNVRIGYGFITVIVVLGIISSLSRYVETYKEWKSDMKAERT